MKLNLKAASACAVAAGLLTVGVQRSEALQISGYVVQTVQFKLVALATDGNGGITKVRITNKDLRDAINADWSSNIASNRKIAYWDEDGDFYLLNSNTGELVEDLTDWSYPYLQGSWSYWWDSYVGHSNGSLKKYSEIGTVFIQFASDGDDSSRTYWSYSTLEFIDMAEGTGTAASTYALKQTGGSVNGAGNQTVTVNETDVFSGWGYDYATSTIDNSSGFPINGTITYTGSGKVPYTNYN